MIIVKFNTVYSIYFKEFAYHFIKNIDVTSRTFLTYSAPSTSKYAVILRGLPIQGLSSPPTHHDSASTETRSGDSDYST